MDKHTPIPWEVQKLNHCDGSLWLQIGYKGSGPIVRVNCTAEKMCPKGAPMFHNVICESKYMATSEEEQIANADFIAHAVNNHDALVEALESIYARFMHGREAFDKLGFLSSDNAEDDVLDVVSCVLSTAKGE